MYWATYNFLIDKVPPLYSRRRKIKDQNLESIKKNAISPRSNPSVAKDLQGANSCCRSCREVLPNARKPAAPFAGHATQAPHYRSSRSPRAAMRLDVLAEPSDALAVSCIDVSMYLIRNASPLSRPEAPNVAF
jgi:hypothetical protein